MHESTPVPTPSFVADSASVNAVAVFPVRMLVGLSLLILTTLVALAVAWVWPENTVLHFWLVAQALPIFYALLAWWWARMPAEAVHEL